MNNDFSPYGETLVFIWNESRKYLRRRSTVESARANHAIRPRDCVEPRRTRRTPAEFSHRENRNSFNEECRHTRPPTPPTALTFSTGRPKMLEKSRFEFRTEGNIDPSGRSLFDGRTVFWTKTTNQPPLCPAFRVDAFFEDEFTNRIRIN